MTATKESIKIAMDMEGLFIHFLGGFSGFFWGGGVGVGLREVHPFQRVLFKSTGLMLLGFSSL